MIKIMRKTRRSFNELIKDHPFEFFLSLALVLFGTRALVVGLQTAPGAVQRLPIVLAIAYCALSVAGGGLVIFGLAARYRFDWSYGAERAGLFVSASAWSSYIVGFLFTTLNSSSALFILALLALSASCLIRARVINNNAKATLIALRQAKQDQESQ